MRGGERLREKNDQTGVEVDVKSEAIWNVNYFVKRLLWGKNKDAGEFDQEKVRDCQHRLRKGFARSLITRGVRGKRRGHPLEGRGGERMISKLGRRRAFWVLWVGLLCFLVGMGAGQGAASRGGVGGSWNRGLPRVSEFMLPRQGKRGGGKRDYKNRRSARSLYSRKGAVHRLWGMRGGGKRKGKGKVCCGGGEAIDGTKVSGSIPPGKNIFPKKKGKKNVIEPDQVQEWENMFPYQ